jgi:hypothetical protein
MLYPGLVICMRVCLRAVLGPLMFLIFINDITDEIVGLGRLFADDTSIEHIAQDERIKNIKGPNTALRHTRMQMTNPG